MNNQIRVLIADANEGFTAQLSGFLGENPAFVVAGVANDGEKAVELLHTVQADLLILDLLLPKLDGISEGSKRAAEAADRAGADGLYDRVCRTGGGKVRRAVLYQQALRAANRRGAGA